MNAVDQFFYWLASISTAFLLFTILMILIKYIKGKDKKK